MNKLDLDYQSLLQDILNNGVEKKDRTGTGTLSVFGRTIRHKMSDGFPLLTTKKIYFKGIVTELIWFLRGDTNIKFLVDNDCHIWDGDAYKSYLQHTILGVNNGLDRISGYFKPGWLIDDGNQYEHFTNPSFFGFRPLTKEEFINKIKTDADFSKRWGNLGPIYGSQWRTWGAGEGHRQDPHYAHNGVDQISNLINDIKKNPDSRRLMVNSWNVGLLDKMVLPPCHYGFQVYTRELSWDERLPLYKRNIVDEYGEVKSHDELTTVDLNKINIPTRAISLMWNQRSVDTFLGLPFNIASYGLLLEIIAKAVNMVPDELIGNLGDVHLYSNHIEQAKEQIGRKYTHEERTGLLKTAMGEERYNQEVSELVPFGGGMSEFYDIYKIPYRTRDPYPLPELKMNPIFLANLEHKDLDTAINGSVNFQLENYKSHSQIKAPLSN